MIMVSIFVLQFSGCGQNNDFELYIPEEIAHIIEADEVDSDSFYYLIDELRIVVSYESTLIRRAARIFEDANPHWSVRLIPFSEIIETNAVSYSDINREILTLMKNGDIDLVNVGGLNYYLLEEAGLLEDFLHLWDSNDFYDILESLLPVVRDYVRRTSATSGRVHQIPIAFSIWTLSPNQFNDHNLEYVGEAPTSWTWNQLADWFEYDMERQEISYLFSFPASFLTSILFEYYHHYGQIEPLIIEEILNAVYMLNERNLIPSDWSEFESSLLSLESFGGQVRDFSSYLTPRGKVYLFPEIQGASGMSINLEFAFAINTRTTIEQQHAAADFVKTLLSKEFQNNLVHERLSPVINELSLEGVLANGGGGVFVGGVDIGTQVNSITMDEVNLYNSQRQAFFGNVNRVRSSRYIYEFGSELVELAMRFYNRQMTMEAIIEYLQGRFPVE